MTADGRAEAIRRPARGGARLGVARPVPGLAEHGVGFKGLAEAIARATARCGTRGGGVDPPPGGARQWLTFVFVGAGHAGLEGIAELQDFVAVVIDRYPRCRLDGTRWILVEAEDRVMQEIPASLAEFATQERGRGMEIRTGTRLEAVEASSATLSTGERIPTAPFAGPRASGRPPWSASLDCRSPTPAGSRSTRRCG